MVGKKKKVDFVITVEKVMKDARKTAKKLPKGVGAQEFIIETIENFYYPNVIMNFYNNLTEENINELKIKKTELTLINKKFSKLFDKAEEILDDDESKKTISKKEYLNFRKEVKKIGIGFNKLMAELNSLMDLDTCDKLVEDFNKEISESGREFGVAYNVDEDGRESISFGFQDGEGFDDDYEERLEKITNFNKFTLDLEKPEPPFKFGWADIDDEKGHFHGQHHTSVNKKYSVIFCDSYEVEDDEGNVEDIPGQVYLIENKKKILWQKDISRPNAAYATNEGEVIVVDWITHESIGNQILVFNKKGKQVFKYKYEPNICDQEYAEKNQELIVSTCAPDNKVYLFNIKKLKLIASIKNPTGRRPLRHFNFKDARKYF